MAPPLKNRVMFFPPLPSSPSFSAPLKSLPPIPLDTGDPLPEELFSRSESKPDLRQDSEPRPLVLVKAGPLHPRGGHKTQAATLGATMDPQTRLHCLVSKANRITASSEGCPSAQEDTGRKAGAPGAAGGESWLVPLGCGRPRSLLQETLDAAKGTVTHCATKCFSH